MYKTKEKLNDEVYQLIRNDIPLREKISKQLGITESSVYVYARRKSLTLSKPVVVEILKKHLNLPEDKLFT